MKIPKAEFLKDPFVVARTVLLGATLYSRIGGRLTAGRIVELELYMGNCDRACHAFKGKTQRNAVMFESGGQAYVYFVYGMHNMFNVVISDTGQPNAILIRALEPLKGIDIMIARRGINDTRNLCNGPAKLTVAMGISTKHNGIDLESDKIWLESATTPIAPMEIAIGTRIGVEYAGEDAALPWRFAIKGSKFISKAI
ncbi:MAG: DNA-3-methyladenine glycosylase [Alphaproteobacteria bacterium]|nr:DNA-3-methyladenine glycosylase [Alphaproteobacteria bacterium]